MKGRAIFQQTGCIFAAGLEHATRSKGGERIKERGGEGVGITCLALRIYLTRAEVLYMFYVLGKIQGDIVRIQHQ